MSLCKLLLGGARRALRSRCSHHLFGRRHVRVLQIGISGDWITLAPPLIGCHHPQRMMRRAKCSPTSKLLGRETGTACSTSGCAARTQMAMSRRDTPRRLAPASVGSRRVPDRLVDCRGPGASPQWCPPTSCDRARREWALVGQRGVHTAAFDSSGQFGNVRRPTSSSLAFRDIIRQAARDRRPVSRVLRAVRTDHR